MSTMEQTDDLEKRTAIASRDKHSSPEIRTPRGEIPNLDQWVRDYISLNQVYDGMVVLTAYVDTEAGTVEELEINIRCATDQAWNNATEDNGINIGPN